MGQKIEIKPNDQQWVGNKLRRPNWEKGYFWNIKFIGDTYIIGKNQDGFEQCIDTDNQSLDWELYSEPEEKCKHYWIDNPFDKNFRFKCSKCGEYPSENLKEKMLARFITEKKCEHEWGLNTNRKSIDDIIKFCKKCGLSKREWEIQGEDKQQEFWLKVGDVIRHEDEFSKGLTVNEKIERITDTEVSTYHISKTGHYFRYDHSKKNVTKDKYKKIKLVSPAIFKNTNSLLNKGRWIISLDLHSEKPVVEGVDQIIWPARDQFGKEIWYEIPVEEE